MISLFSARRLKRKRPPSPRLSTNFAGIAAAFLADGDFIFSPLGARELL
jgi:hypothetical protein